MPALQGSRQPLIYGAYAFLLYPKRQLAENIPVLLLRAEKRYTQQLSCFFDP